MTMNDQFDIEKLIQNAKDATPKIAGASTKTKNNAILAFANALKDQESAILAENAKDITAGKQKGLSDALIDRLALNEARLAAMQKSLYEIAALPDPVGQINQLVPRPSGIVVGKMRVPIGILLMIYEARPNVTADAGALCLKSGNVVILRGGREALHSNTILARLFQEAIVQSGLPKGTLQLVEKTDREMVTALLQCQTIDLVIPRGGKGLIEEVIKHAKMPVLKHLDGNCHVYIDEEANIDMAIEIAVNAKTQRFGVCNAMETLLVDAKIAPQILPKLTQRLVEKNVVLRADEKARLFCPAASPATEEDWYTEYLAPILAIKVVSGVEEAIAHINYYGSKHTDAIITDNYAKALRFLREVDSSSVMVNASTRFADGYEYGLGAEIGISTDKLHARGPVGLLGLTTEKYIVLGHGEIRQ
jgi:glutamate-5-semialdehyde dehydrogenase